MSSSRSLPLSLPLALLPLVVTILLISFNILHYGTMASEGPHQVALLLGGALACFLAHSRGVSLDVIGQELRKQFYLFFPTFIFLLVIGSLAVTWLVGGIVPTLIYYVIDFLSPRYFAVTASLLCGLVALVTGSSWTTIATLGVALMGVGRMLGLPDGWVAGSIISGAYFGDKLSPLSESTTISAGSTGTPLLVHVRGMLGSSLLAFAFTLTLYFFLGLWSSTAEVNSVVNTAEIKLYLSTYFYIDPLLLLIPCIVVLWVLFGGSSLYALSIGALLGGIVALVYQQALFTRWDTTPWRSLVHIIFFGVHLDEKGGHALSSLLMVEGIISGILPVIALMLSAMVLGGGMTCSGGLQRLTTEMDGIKSKTVIFLVTAVIGFLFNMVLADQTLALLMIGRLLEPLFRAKQMKGKDLSRLMEDVVTVSSPLIPWNTCGATQAATLGVPVFTYMPYAFFSFLSPVFGLGLSIWRSRSQK